MWEVGMLHLKQYLEFNLFYNNGMLGDFAFGLH